MTRNQLIRVAVIAAVVVGTTALQMEVRSHAEELVEQGGVWKFLVELAYARVNDEMHSYLVWGLPAGIMVYGLFHWLAPQWGARGKEVMNFGQIEGLLTVVAVVLVVLVLIYIVVILWTG